MNTTDPTEPEKLLTEKEAACLLSLNPSTLQRWRWSGKGPKFIKLGGAVRYRVADLEAFIEAGVRHSTSEPGGPSNG